MDPEPPKFTHRFNPNGTIDSICHGCLRTIGSVRAEAALADFEVMHICGPEETAFFPSEKYVIPD